MSDTPVRIWADFGVDSVDMVRGRTGTAQTAEPRHKHRKVAQYVRVDPPTDALVNLIEQMKELGLWDHVRGCPKGCVDSVKWQEAQENNDG